MITKTLDFIIQSIRVWYRITLFWLLTNFSVKPNQLQLILTQFYSAKMLLLRKSNSSKSFQASCYRCLLSKIFSIFT